MDDVEDALVGLMKGHDEGDGHDLESAILNSRTLEVMKEELVELNKERFVTQFGLEGSNQVGKA